MKGNLIIYIGLAIVAIGLFYAYFPQTLTWFGNLPGDIKVEKPNAKFYFPVTSMILISIFINVVIRLIKYLQ